jgi:hypothetical protein
MPPARRRRSARGGGAPRACEGGGGRASGARHPHPRRRCRRRCRRPNGPPESCSAVRPACNAAPRGAAARPLRGARDGRPPAPRAIAPAPDLHAHGGAARGGPGGHARLGAGEPQLHGWGWGVRGGGVGRRGEGGQRRARSSWRAKTEAPRAGRPQGAAGRQISGKWAGGKFFSSPPGARFSRARPRQRTERNWVRERRERAAGGRCSRARAGGPPRSRGPRRTRDENMVVD